MSGLPSAGNSELQLLRDDFVITLPDRLTGVQSYWQRLEQNWKPEEETRIEQLLDSLGKVAELYGYGKVAGSARAVRSKLHECSEVSNARATLTAEQRDAVNAELDRLRAAADQLGSEEETTATDHQLVFMLHDDAERTAPLVANLKRGGYRVTALQNYDELVESTDAFLPVCVVVQVAQYREAVSDTTKIQEIQKGRNKRIPVAFIGDDNFDRLHAIRAGGDAYFQHPINPAQFVSQIEILAADVALSSYKVTVVSEVTADADEAVKLLNEFGIQTQVVSDIEFESTAEFDFDLVLLISPSNASEGVTALRSITKSDGSLPVPIVLLVNAAGSDTYAAAMERGASECLVMPDDQEHLIAVVMNGIQRARGLRSQAHTGRQYGRLASVCNRDFFLVCLENAAKIGVARNIPFALLYLSFDELAALAADAQAERNVDAMLTASEELLVASLRNGDVITRWENGTLLILLKRALANDAKKVAERLCKRIGEELVQVGELTLTTTCTIGVTVVAQEEANVFEVVRQAQSASALARSMGGNRIALHHEAEGVLAKESHDEDLKRLIRKTIVTKQFEFFHQPIVCLGDNTKETYWTTLDVFNEKAGSRLGSTLWTISAGEGLLGRVDRCLAQATIDVLAARDGGSARLLMQFSVDSLVDEGFSSWLTERFVEAKLASDNFIVGFDTEDVVMHLKDGARLFAELADIGVETALMNFGRAKNPFLAIKHVPVNLLFVYGSTVQDISKNNQSETAFKLLVERAHSMEKEVVVPQVDNAAMLPALWRAEVDYITGPFVREPAPEMDFDFAEGL